MLRNKFYNFLVSHVAQSHCEKVSDEDSDLVMSKVTFCWVSLQQGLSGYFFFAPAVFLFWWCRSDFVVAATSAVKIYLIYFLVFEVMTLLCTRGMVDDKQ